MKRLFSILGVLTTSLITSCSVELPTVDLVEQRKVIGAQYIVEEGAFTPIVDLQFKITVKTDKGMQLCSGDVNYTLTTTYSFDPVGTLICLAVGAIDVNEMMGDPRNVVFESDQSFRNFPGFGSIIRNRNPVELVPGAARWSPPKPYIINPLFPNLNDPELQNLDFYEPNSQVEGISRDGKPYRASGAWRIKMVGSSDSFTPPHYIGSETFKDIMQFEVTAEGFDHPEVGKSEYRVMDVQRFTMSTKPVTPLEIVYVTPLEDLLAGQTAGGIGGAIGGLIGKTAIVSIELYNSKRFKANR